MHVVSDIAHDRLLEWPSYRDLMPLTAAYTRALRALRAYGFERTNHGHVRTDDIHGRHIDQGYDVKATGDHVRITVSTTPKRPITIRTGTADGLHTKALPRDTPAEAVAARIVELMGVGPVLIV
ncbi:hypothetical protein [Microtetraspora sp. NBRC 16547]|uniref:hypothetical protein n=1 Tax=Microtetraspora sp. NBRC 16547 TaxID=3030993 RepID=UPI0024A3FED2|nr:hypothetical protein [Microtetraspora sp. NBRC 16547]GLW98783.1 hypothetical protein Misp02_28700 [Microtetraspora sp. NBRC 16547]